PPKVFARLISSDILRTPGTRRSQLGLRGRQASPREQWRQLRELDLLGEPEQLKHPDPVPIHVYLVPPQAVSGGSGMRMMVVVPAFAKCEHSDKPVIGGIISRGKTA